MGRSSNAIRTAEHSEVVVALCGLYILIREKIISLYISNYILLTSPVFAGSLDNLVQPFAIEIDICSDVCVSSASTMLVDERTVYAHLPIYVLQRIKISDFENRCGDIIGRFPNNNSVSLRTDQGKEGLKYILRSSSSIAHEAEGN